MEKENPDQKKASTKVGDIQADRELCFPLVLFSELLILLVGSFVKSALNENLSPRHEQIHSY